VPSDGKAARDPRLGEAGRRALQAQIDGAGADENHLRADATVAERRAERRVVGTCRRHAEQRRDDQPQKPHTSF
jgi:hypothetical protein